MDRPDRQIERLNALGRLVWLGGAAARFTAGALEHLVERTAAVAADAERAFRQGLDPEVEDAKILDEHDR